MENRDPSPLQVDLDERTELGPAADRTGEVNIIGRAAGVRRGGGGGGGQNQGPAESTFKLGRDSVGILNN